MDGAPPSRRDNVVVLAVVAFQSFFYSIMLSMVPPFFPVQARKLGLSGIDIGAVFSIFSATVLFTSIAVGHNARRIGKKRLLAAGIVLECAGLAVFGLCSRLWQFLLLRAVQGIGAGASNTAAFALLADHFPSRFGFVNGLVQTIIGVGFMLGPPLGTWLFEIGGFPAPFLGTAATTFICLSLALLALPPDRHMLLVVGKQGRSHPPPHPSKSPSAKRTAATSAVSVWSPLMRPRVAITGGVVCIVSTAFSDIDATLSLYLKKELGLTSMYYSVAFFTISLLYAVVSTIVGFVTDRFHVHKLFMAVGMALVGAFMVVFGLGIASGSFIWALVVLGLIGTGGAACIIPSCPDMLACGMAAAARATATATGKATGTSYDGMQEEEQSPVVVDVVSPIAGLHSALYASGQIAGPLLGTGLAAALSGYETMYIAVGACVAGYGTLVLLPYAVAQTRRLVALGQGGRYAPRELGCSASDGHGMRADSGGEVDVDEERLPLVTDGGEAGVVWT